MRSLRCAGLKSLVLPLLVHREQRTAKSMQENQIVIAFLYPDFAIELLVGLAKVQGVVP